MSAFPASGRRCRTFPPSDNRGVTKTTVILGPSGSGSESLSESKCPDLKADSDTDSDTDPESLKMDGSSGLRGFSYAQHYRHRPVHLAGRAIDRAHVLVGILDQHNAAASAVQVDGLCAALCLHDFCKFV